MCIRDRTYSKIGGWVKGFEFDWRKYRIPPKVSAVMDESQQWAVTIAAEALADYGYPERPLDTDRTGVILGTAMGGELHYVTSQRIFFPELDVYKRQAWEIAIKRAIGKLKTPEGDYLEELNLHRFTPVSYTHLDVYKRQAIPCASMASPCSARRR